MKWTVWPLSAALALAASSLAWAAPPAAATDVDPHDFGAICDGVVRTPDDTAALQAAADKAFGSQAAPHGQSAWLNRPLHIPRGTCEISAPIQFEAVRGGLIYGDGRFTSTIVNRAGTGVFKIDGMGFSRMAGLYLRDAGRTASVIDLSWDNHARQSLQSNTFEDLYIDGGGVGVAIGAGGYMGSENLFKNVFVGGCAIAGYKTDNFNALQNTLVGGNIQSCAIGVWMRAGVMNVYSTGFQLSRDEDIRIDNSANDAVVISGVRTESPNFLVANNGIVASLIGVSQTSAKRGVFAAVGGHLYVEGSTSIAGQVLGRFSGEIRASTFGRTDWLGPLSSPSSVHVSEVCYDCAQGGAGRPTLIADKTVNMTAAGPVTYWATRRAMIAVPTGSTGSATLAVAANTRIGRVALVVDAPASAGACDVGDREDPTAYLRAAPLSGPGAASARTDRLYSADDSIVVACRGAASGSAFVAIDLVAMN